MSFQKPWCSLCFTQQSIGDAWLLPPSSKDGTSWNHKCTTQAEDCYWNNVTVQTFLTRVIPSGASKVGLPQVNPDWQANSRRVATGMWFQPMRTAAWATLGIVMGMKLVKALGAGKPPRWVLMFLNLLRLCPALCNPMDCSPPGSSVPGTLQVRILAWVVMPSSRGSSWPQETCVSYVSSTGRWVLDHRHHLGSPFI